ncbi:MAG: hypothetical protein KGZ66_04760 [Selenomonadales bacterium]|nr:hypothetical protein [Selenomonadales bacterium]
MYRKTMAVVLFLALLLTSTQLHFVAQANRPISVTVNGRALVADVAPVIRNGRTLVPFRAIFEALGAQVEWDERANLVAGYFGPQFVLLNPGSPRAWRTGREMNLDVAPVIIQGRTMVPLRFVAESLGATVEWVDATNSVAITHTPLTPRPAPRSVGDFNTVYSGELTTLNYLVTATSAEHVIAANTVSALVQYDEFGILYPSLARHWRVSPDGLTYTFTLRQGVPWLTWEGREYAETTAQDFVDAMRYVLTPANASRTANIVWRVIRGAEDFFNARTTDFSTVGIRAVDRYTVEYTLISPVPYFLSMLTYVPFFPANGRFLTETGARFGTDHTTLLYNGPYILTSHIPQQGREFVRNERYWERANVHIQRLSYRFNREAAALAPEMFFRGEITAASIPIAILDGWLQDPARRNLVRPAAVGNFSFWFAFNFNPRFAAEHQPDNWRLAVNNVNFRKAVFHGLDRIAAMMTFDPYNPERQLQNTIIPHGFVTVDGLDYTELPPLARLRTTNLLDRRQALEFRNRAQVELRAQGATFPIRMMMPFNTGSPDWVNRVQVMEQQLESVLGRGFIDVVPVGFPPTGFLDATRRAGNYAFQEVNWGPDYGDPRTYFDPFLPGNTYSPINTAQGWTGNFDRLIEQANAELLNVRRRFELFAQAEAYLIENAYVIPYRRGGGGYVASRLHPFTGAFAAFGVAGLSFERQIILERPMNMEQFNQAEAEWQRQRAAELKRWGQ